MVNRRIAAVAVLSAASIAVAGCSSTTSGHGGPSGSSTTTTSAATPKPTATDAASLATLVQRGVETLTSAHLTLDVGVGEQKIRGAGDETLSHTKLVAFDLAETISGAGTLRMRLVGGKTYVNLPPSMSHSGKPWTLITANSSDPVIKSMNSALSTLRDAASVNSPATFVRVAKSVKLLGSEPVNGAPANHYSIKADVTKLPSSFPGRQALISAGLSTLPVELWVDSAGRPVKVVEKLTTQGQTVSSEVTLSRFNAPVHITAPPADQVGTS
jgi:hypothetical protein